MIAEALHAGVDAAASIAVERLAVAQLQDLIASASREAARLTGIASRAVAELDARGGGLVPTADGGACPLPAWLRQAGNLSATAAGREVRTAVALRELPQVADAVVDGMVTLEHGRVLGRLVGLIAATASPIRVQPAGAALMRNGTPSGVGQAPRRHFELRRTAGAALAVPWPR